MIEPEWAREFAKDWIEAWNSHDLDRILSQYSDDVEVSSPLVVERLDRPDGVVSGKDLLRDYWSSSMSMEPPLEFELLDVLVGLNHLTLYYRSVGRRVVAETLSIDASGKATRGFIQWSVTQDKE